MFQIGNKWAHLRPGMLSLPTSATHNTKKKKKNLFKALTSEEKHADCLLSRVHIMQTSAARELWKLSAYFLNAART